MTNQETEICIKIKYLLFEPKYLSDSHETTFQLICKI